MKARVTIILRPKPWLAKWGCEADGKTTMTMVGNPATDVRISSQDVECNPDGSVTFDPVTIPVTHEADIDVVYYPPPPGLYDENDGDDDRAEALVVEGDDTWHGGPGWYYYDTEYPDEGSVGPFPCATDACAHATRSDYRVMVGPETDVPAAAKEPA